MANTIEQLKKAIKHYECERDGAIVVLDSGFGSRPGESDLLYRKRKERAQIAIDAIEKQIPKAPLPEERYYGNGKCPRCAAVFLDKSTHYCGNCGQALEWRADNA